MGQQEVYEFLKENQNTWFTSREISDNLGVSIGSVTMNLKKLRKSKLIGYRNTGKKNMFQYMYSAPVSSSTKKIKVKAVTPRE